VKNDNLQNAIKVHSALLLNAILLTIIQLNAVLAGLADYHFFKLM
jgi:hypothetical protein